MVFLQNSLRSLAGNFGAEFDPKQGIRNPGAGNNAPSQKSRPGETRTPRSRQTSFPLKGELFMLAIQRRMGTSATRIYAQISTSIPHPLHSLLRLLCCSVRGAQPSKARRARDIVRSLRQNPVRRWLRGDIGGFPMEPSAPRRRAPSPR